MYNHSHLAEEALERMKEQHQDKAYQPEKYSSEAIRADVLKRCPDNARQLLNTYRLRVLRLKELLFYCYENLDRDMADRIRHRMVARHKEYDARLSEFIKTNQ